MNKKEGISVELVLIFVGIAVFLIGLSFFLPEEKDKYAKIDWYELKNVNYSSPTLWDYNYTVEEYCDEEGVFLTTQCYKCYYRELYTNSYCNISCEVNDTVTNYTVRVTSDNGEPNPPLYANFDNETMDCVFSCYGIPVAKGYTCIYNESSLEAWPSEND